MIRTLKKILKEFTQRSEADDISGLAAQLTFYLILSIFPFLIFIVTIINRITFIDMDTIYLGIEMLPLEIQSFLTLIIDDLADSNMPDSVLPITLISTIWASSKGFMAIIKGLNKAYNHETKTHFILLRLKAIFFTLIFAFAIFVTLVLIVFGRLIIDGLYDLFPVLVQLSNVITIGRFILAYVGIYLFFIIVYHATHYDKLAFKAVTPGAMFATFGWILVSSAFSFYLKYLSNLSYIYGSLTSIIILLLWLFLTSLILMMGGELNAIISRIQVHRNENDA